MTKRMIGPFELGDRIGVGGMGIVYRATYTKTGAAVAIKILSPDLSDAESLQKRFEREITILKKLQDPHIVRYYGGGKLGNQRFYAMELVTGGSLEGELEKRKKLPWQEVVSFAKQIAIALEHAHTAGVIHRDLKPANLLLTQNRTLKLTDFGIARDTTATALTAAGRTVGTYAYMAPEQIRGKPPVDRKTDLYALGCVMYEMLTGQTPFTGTNQGEMLLQHLQEDPPRPSALEPECPIWLENLIMQMLQKEPEDRPYDALAVQVALDEIVQKVEEQTSLARQAASGGPSLVSNAVQEAEAKKLLKKKKKKKKKAVPVYERWWFLTACGLALVAFTTWALWPPSERKRLEVGRSLMAKEGYLEDARRYMEETQRRFPDGELQADVRADLEQIEMLLFEKAMRIREKRNQPPTSVAERDFQDGERLEKFGDRLSAAEKYESIVSLFADQPKERPVVNLARRQLAAIRSQGGEGVDRAKLIEQKLAQADEDYTKGRTLEARTIWQSVVTLYGDNRELSPLVDRARAQLAAEKAQ